MIDSECEPDWKSFGMNCYNISYNEMMNWTSAEESCKQKGAHLTSIHSIEKNEFLINNFISVELAPMVFIGGLRANAWNDGTYFKYANWIDGVGETTGKLNISSCDYISCIAIHGYDGQWEPVPCDTEFSYICKKSRQGNYMVFLTDRKIHDVNGDPTEK